MGLFKAWQAGKPATAPPQVTARVVPGTPGELSDLELLRMVRERTARAAEARALERDQERMIEAQAGQVVLPWSVKAPDPPKA